MLINAFLVSPVIPLQKLDTSSPGGRPTFQIFGALAEFERTLIKERTMAGLASARARGRVGGRPRAFTEDDLTVARTLLGIPMFPLATSQSGSRFRVQRSTATSLPHAMRLTDKRLSWPAL